MTAIAGVNYHQASDQFFQIDINHRLFFSKYPALLHVCARKTGEVPSFENMSIQQNFYLNAWEGDFPANNDSSFVSKIKSFLRSNRFLYESARSLYHVMGYSRSARHYDINKVLKSFE